MTAIPKPHNMIDYYRNAITQLLRCNYDIFLPLQKPFCDELVVSNGDWLRRGLVRSVLLCNKKGPLVTMKVSKKGDAFLLDGFMADILIASYPESSDVWLVSLEDVVAQNTIRLASREVIEPIRRTDEPASIIAEKEVVDRMKEEHVEEKRMVKESKNEQAFYSRILESE